MIRFACPVCSASMTAPDDAAGKKGPCPKCGQRLKIPSPNRNRTMLGLSHSNERKDGSAPLVLPKEAASDIQSVRPPVLAPASSRRSWFRLTSPTFLMGALVLFFLPWVDIRCGAADSGKTLASQSGFQMIYGGYSLPAAWESQGVDGAQYVKEKFGIESRSFAPFLGVFFLLLIGATVGTFSVGWRPFALGLAIVSLLILSGHLLFGLPAQRDLAFFYRALAKDNGFNGAAILIETRLTIWFWLTLLFLIGAVGSLGGDSGGRLRRWRAT